MYISHPLARSSLRNTGQTRLENENKKKIDRTECYSRDIQASISCGCGIMQSGSVHMAMWTASRSSLRGRWGYSRKQIMAASLRSLPNYPLDGASEEIPHCILKVTQVRRYHSIINTLQFLCPLSLHAPTHMNFFPVLFSLFASTAPYGQPM